MAMPDDVMIEIANTGDAETILTLQKLAFESEARLYDDWSIAPLHESLEEISGLFAKMIFLKAVCDGEVVGSVRGYLRGEMCNIGRLIVHPSFRGRGIGTALMHAIEDQFPQASRFELSTGYLSEGNIRLYERLGYSIYSTEAVTPKLTLVNMAKEH